ncbi:myrosinase 1 [Diachasma alloeum]|uniref:myrosinase 1 n=1 Tax=Diachasma alloeum TaxID=454923 RepID=UPI0007382772|nr:myrosinase 1 [Diachasma alloeum]
MKTVLLAVQILYFSSQVSAVDPNLPEIPENFLVGAGSSAYQVEGAWNVSDKGEGMWDRWTHNNASYFGSGGNGDIAADSYHKYKEDVQLLKSMKLDVYRFSISWSRVLPTGSPYRVSRDGIQYYKNLINELLANGIVPFPTMYHFDDLQSLMEKTGGWANESMVEYFADYARVLFRELGPKVKHWTTINELNIYCGYIFYHNETDPDLAFSARYRCVHNQLKAHARAYHIYNEEFRSTQGGQVGLVVHSTNYVPVVAGDVESSKIAFDFDTGWIMHPIFSMEGGYPEVMKQRIAENSRAEGLSSSRLPEFSPEWTDYIRGSSDYLGINHFVTSVVERVPKRNGRWYDDLGLRRTQLTTSGTRIYPEGIGAVLRQIRDEYYNPPVYILENGMAEGATFNDTDRIYHLHFYMKEVMSALNDGCDIRSYAVWSLLDSFEWVAGYTQRFGLIHVDFNHPNRTRTPKLSSYWMKAVMEGRKLIPIWR